MKLTEKDRLILMQALPQQASLQDMGVIIECNELLKLSDEEKSAISYRESDGTIMWNNDRLTEKEVPLKHDHIGVLKTAVNKASDEGRVTAVSYQTYMKIVNE